MKVKVLKGFANSLDGVRTVDVAEGETIDVLDDCAPGLIAEGLVEQIDEAELPLDGDTPGPRRRKKPAAE